jgi:ATP-dependent DNA helicase RecQ
MTPLDILQKKFGFPEFRLHQEAAIKAVLEKRDCFVLMPTGGGKSLCYQVPALLLDGLTLVVSPLIALMKDQVDALRLSGIEAAYLNSTQGWPEQQAILKKIEQGTLKLLYLAPESSFLKQLTGLPIRLIAIDEAHCISHWGHDFRPEYLKLAQLKTMFPGVPVIGLTATADRVTRNDIVEKLGLQDPAIFVSSFNRANIRYNVDSKVSVHDKLLTFLETRREESGIIYCLSRASTEAWAGNLTRAGFPALAYHAGMDKDMRAQNQEKFLRDDVRIIVATIAFGMGIDKSNVRFVVHMDLPKNIESYYQETGRAGRDGLPSEALLFYSYGDVSKMRTFVTIADNPEQTEIYLHKLEQMGTYGELSTCRRKYLLNYFDEETETYCGNCDSCLTRYEPVDSTALAQQLLSAVNAVGQRFGSGYVIDFLRGAETVKIQDPHKALEGFGSGMATGKDVWTALVRELLSQGHLLRTSGQYPVLKLTTRGLTVLAGEQKVITAQPRGRMDADVQVLYEPDLLHELKAMRKLVATRENVASYQILSDATLVEMATYLPQDQAELRQVSGFGDVKLERYGKLFGQVVTAYCQQKDLGSRMEKRPARPARRRSERFRRETDSDTKRESLRLFEEGRSLEEVASARNLAESTVETHLAYFVAQGKLDAASFIDLLRVPAVQQARDQAERPGISAIKELLGDEFSYRDIRMALAHLEYKEDREKKYAK